MCGAPTPLQPDLASQPSVSHRTPKTSKTTSLKTQLNCSKSSYRVTRVTSAHSTYPRILGTFYQTGFCSSLDVILVLWAVYKRKIQFLTSNTRTLWSFRYRTKGDMWLMILTSFTDSRRAPPWKESRWQFLFMPPPFEGRRIYLLHSVCTECDYVWGTRFPASIITISKNGNS